MKTAYIFGDLPDISSSLIAKGIIGGQVVLSQYCLSTT